MPRPRGLHFPQYFVCRTNALRAAQQKTCLFSFFLYPIFMSETKKEEQLPAEAQKLKKNGEKHKKIGIGFAVGGILMVGGAILTAVLGGPIVLICILFGLSAVAVAGEVYSFCKYRSCKKNVENIMKTPKTDKNAEIKQERSENKNLQKKQNELEEKKQNLQEENKKLNKTVNLNFAPTNTTEANGLNNNGLIITNVDRKTGTANSGVKMGNVQNSGLNNGINN